MAFPYHHGHLTNLAVRNPAQLIFVVPWRYGRGLAEITKNAHRTFTRTVLCHGTIDPAGGVVVTAVDQVPEVDPGPVVAK